MIEKNLKTIREQFLQCFQDYGCKKEPAVNISSDIDPTVLFIGSNINTLKKYILDVIPEEGVVIDQPAMRFRETKHLFNRDYYPRYGAFFNEMGAVTPPVNGMALCTQMHLYFTQYLNIPEDDILLRINSRDTDLQDIGAAVFKNLEYDTMPEKYYQHVIGEAGYTGRNFNVALRNKSNGTFDDVGNFLSFQKDGKDAFLEVALGDTVIQKSLCGHEHVLDCYNIGVPQNLIRIDELNYINAIAVTTKLYQEGLRASNKDNQERILSKYVRYLSMLKQEGKITYSDIHLSACLFEENYCGVSSEIGDIIVSDLEQKETVFKKTLVEQHILSS